MIENWEIWLGFNLMVLVMLAVDLLVFNRKAHEIKIKESLIWSAVWISLAMLFMFVVYWVNPTGAENPMEGVKLYFAGYLLEKALSVDNLFVFVLIFQVFKIPPKYQHRLLFWGIIGALVLRGLMIFLGAALVSRFHWVLYIFGVFLVYTAVKLVTAGDEGGDPRQGVVMRMARKVLPITDEDPGGHFVKRIDGKLFFTTFFVVLLIVETTDVVFALDSIPAIFGITTNTFIIYTSNVMAILGLRALYFALAGLMDMFYYLKHGLAVVLAFIGVKMILPAFGDYHVPINWALAVILVVLGLAVVASIIKGKRDHAAG